MVEKIHFHQLYQTKLQRTRNWRKNERFAFVQEQKQVQTNVVVIEVTKSRVMTISSSFVTDSTRRIQKNVSKTNSIPLRDNHFFFPSLLAAAPALNLK